MSTFERMHEFGMLLSLGCGPGRLARIVTVEAMLIGLVGVGDGTVLAFALLLVTSHTGLDYAALGGGDSYEAAFGGLHLSTLFLRGLTRDVVAGVIAVFLTSLLSVIWPIVRISGSSRWRRSARDSSAPHQVPRPHPRSERPPDPPLGRRRGCWLRHRRLHDRAPSAPLRCVCVPSPSRGTGTSGSSLATGRESATTISVSPIGRPLAAVRAADGVHAAAPHSRTTALLAFGTRVDGLEMLGVEPEAEFATNRLVRMIEDGRYLESGDTGVAVIGSAVANHHERYPVYWTLRSTYLNCSTVIRMISAISTIDWAEDEPRLRPTKPSW